MPDPDMRLLQVAFAMLKGTTVSLLRVMEERGVSLDDFFSLDTAALGEALGMTRANPFDSYTRDEAVAAAREELKFMERHNISVRFYGEDDYPERLSQLHDAPVALFVLGEADLNAGKAVSVVGTRTPTPYGVGFAQKFVADLAEGAPGALVISGLAYGIDATAHTAALQSGLPTAAVVAHGLGMIYPASHRSLAENILRAGGAIVTEYTHDCKPFRGRFLERNRIVAAMSDATLVVESDVRGGAMSTATVAFNADREVFALPGRVSDRMSSGCNHLIQCQKAQLITSASDMMRTLGWEVREVDKVETATLFPELEEPQKSIYELLQSSSEPVTADAIRAVVGLPIGSLLAVLGEMEFDGLIVRYPSTRFRPA